MTLKCLRVNRTETIDLNEQKSSRLTRTNACGFWLVLGTCNVSSELKVIFWFSCRYFAIYSTITTTTTLSTLSNQAEMPDWKQNKFEGVYKFGAAYPMQKRYQILKDFAATSSFSASARENRVSYNTARSICDKFATTGDCQPGARGRPDCKMQPFMAAYLEAMVLVNPFL